MFITGCVFLGIFALFSGTHLFFCYVENEKLRKITKTFCLALLSTASFFFLYDHPFIYLGALMGMIGDYFLLKKNHLVAFVLGVLFFFIGHLFYLNEMVDLFNWPNFAYPIFYGCLILFLIVFALIFYPKTKLLAGKVALLGNAYYGLMIVNFVISLTLIGLSNFKVEMVIIALGYILFMFSDSFLLYTSYVKDVKRRDFYIMLTYLLGQLFIVVSLVFVGLGI